MSQTLCLQTAYSVWPDDKIIITSMHFAYYKQYKTFYQSKLKGPYGFLKITFHVVCNIALLQLFTASAQMNPMF